jgi:hypothetical protein
MMRVPVMSDGIRSGVNWMRLKSSDRHRASVEIMSVFARPGTPSRMQRPRLNSAISSSSMTLSWPTMTRVSCDLMLSNALFRRRIASMSPSPSGTAGWSDTFAEGFPFQPPAIGSLLLIRGLVLVGNQGMAARGVATPQAAITYRW